ncbi:odorant receptor 46a-like isoform X2 [Aphis craccivora]|uniref:Odorant receptor 46a-like isoform X2 n=1 Tax=Aphis craccivora TaxID=307492 RepID=A0A6G0Z7E2_APHCR|nr:odorant receptor 46a-like isoform X2 [Aphis craccivora]
MRRKIKLFYTIMKPTILLTVAIDSLCIILLTYMFILVCLTPGPDTLLPLISSSVAYITGSRLGLIIINLHAERIVQMNDANRMVIKASPRKIINLLVFNIMSMSFNMVPVLLKITNSENHNNSKL